MDDELQLLQDLDYKLIHREDFMSFNSQDTA